MSNRSFRTQTEQDYRVAIPYSSEDFQWGDLHAQNPVSRLPVRIRKLREKKEQEKKTGEVADGKGRTEA